MAAADVLIYSVGLLASLDVLYRAGASSCTLVRLLASLDVLCQLLASLDVLYRAAGKS